MVIVIIHKLALISVGYEIIIAITIIIWIPMLLSISKLQFTYIPVFGRIKEAHWVIKKISPGDIKNITQWFWCQSISTFQSFLLKP